MKTLTEIGKEHGTDKALDHDFTTLYDKHLSHMREMPINLLEIGILHGSSLRMWEEYFSNGNISGADIHKCDILFDRAKTYVCNQEIVNNLRSLPVNQDIVIDDGGHTMKQQQTTFKVLFLENLKSGGIYILEDLHTSLPLDVYREYGRTDTNNTLLFLQCLQKGVYEGDFYVSENEFNDILTFVDSVQIFETVPNSITSIITKK